MDCLHFGTMLGYLAVFHRSTCMLEFRSVWLLFEFSTGIAAQQGLLSP